MKLTSVRALAALALPAAILLSSCATPESRIRAGLVRAGLSEPMAGCMARTLTDRLSNAQLRRIATLTDGRGIDPNRTTVSEMVRHLSTLGDPEILRAATASAISCAI
ncbi:hypothetical protein M2336_003359 [Sphingobium sp. B1D7B]|uniref:hypothetical protein n=2 Tax=Sphingomonadaceae TaxID=41297 RepID=UPI0015EBE121|nr:MULTISPECIES: hypothetical protein [unclassified Sphingobium]MCW2391514.1 hypothetical protein [Sphingobium sp. B11D3A]MCW2406730.1 hypothetical protein [Sphingobium sp. B1D7B]